MAEAAAAMVLSRSSPGIWTSTSQTHEIRDDSEDKLISLKLHFRDGLVRPYRHKFGNPTCTFASCEETYSICFNVHSILRKELVRTTFIQDLNDSG